MIKVYVHNLFGRFEDLAKLKILKLTSNQFQRLPSAVYKLSALVELDVSYSKELVLIEERILKLTNLQKLECNGCKLLEYPPYAVCKKSLLAIQNYFKDPAKEIELTGLRDVITGKQCFENLTS